MPRVCLLLGRVFFVLIGFLVSAALLTAQENTCDRKVFPCLQQPYAGDVKVLGTWTAPAVNLSIKIYGSATVVAGTVNSGANSAFEFDSLKLLGQYDKVEVYETAAPAKTTGQVSVLAKPTSEASATSTIFTLGLVGINATGSASSGPSQQYFAEFDLMAPLQWLPSKKVCSGNGNSALTRRCWVWINPRIASVPSATSTAISSISASSLPTGLTSETVGQITQSFEFQGGAEYYLIKPKGTSYWGGGNSWARSTVSLIAGGGVVTPFNSTTSATEFGLNANLAQEFSQSPSLVQQYPQLAGALCSYGLTSSASFTCPAAPATKPTSVAFLLPNRSRFDRDYYAGVRLRFFYSTGDCSRGDVSGQCKLVKTYPGTVDFRFGEDETVTAGHLVPLVMTVAGSFPLPGTSGSVRIFGATYMRLRRNQDSTPLILIPTSPPLTLDNPAVVVQQTPRSDQDYFRLGIGVDLIAAIAKWWKPPSNSNGPAPTD